MANGFNCYSFAGYHAHRHSHKRVLSATSIQFTDKPFTCYLRIQTYFSTHGSVIRSELCNWTQKTPLCQALENLPTTHPQPLQKTSATIYAQMERSFFWFVSLSNMCTQFTSSWMVYVIWRGYGPTFSQVHCPQFDYFRQPAASWIVQCVPHKSGSSVRRKKNPWAKHKIRKDSISAFVWFSHPFLISLFLKEQNKTGEIRWRSSTLLFF